MKTEAPTTLHIVSSDTAPSTSGDALARRLSLARRHIETAIAHINDAAQSRIPQTMTADTAPGVDELRLIVRALADIREALQPSDARNPVDTTA